MTYRKYAYPAQSKITELVEAGAIKQLGTINRIWECSECGEQTKDSGNVGGHYLRQHGEPVTQKEMTKTTVVAGLDFAIQEAEAALGVILLDKRIKAWMAVNDPMAQEQVQRAYDGLQAVKIRK